MAGRLLRATLGDPISNVAAEEAIFFLCSSPTMRAWENQRSVVLGRAQLAKAETDLGYCAAHAIPVVRRFTAGGTVYHGVGNLNWSFFFPRESSSASVGYRDDPSALFASFGKAVAAALGRCGVRAEFDPPNAVRTTEGKVSGMAAYISRNAALCHGTLLVGADLVELAKVTTPSTEKLDRRYPRSRAAKVANTGVDPADFVDALAAEAGFSGEEGRLSDEEAEETRTLVRAKYSTASWNLGDPFASDDL